MLIDLFVGQRVSANEPAGLDIPEMGAQHSHPCRMGPKERDTTD